jgi:hypothetical protein
MRLGFGAAGMTRPGSSYPFTVSLTMLTVSTFKPRISTVSLVLFSILLRTNQSYHFNSIAQSPPSLNKLRLLVCIISLHLKVRILISLAETVVILHYRFEGVRKDGTR